MSLPNYDLQISDNGTPTHIYLLQIDSSLNQRPNESQEFPLHILNNTSDYSQGQIYIPIQTLEEGQDQLETLIDAQKTSELKYITQVERTHQKIQKKSLPSTHKQHIQYDEPKEISVTETQSATVLVNSDELLHSTSKQQVVQNYFHIPDRIILPRAFAVLPNILSIRHKDVIAPRRKLPARTRFGPVVGIRNKMDADFNVLDITATVNKTPLFVLRNDNEIMTHVDVTDKDKSNWIGLLPLGDETTANVWIYEENSELYIITTEAIPARKQLMLGYSKKYAQDYGVTGPIKDIDTECSLDGKSWWCYECPRTLSSFTQLQRHMNAYHQESRAIKRRYRCSNCTLTFSRIFTLRRHIARHCKKKINKRPRSSVGSDAVASARTIPIQDKYFENVVNTEVPPEASLNSTLNTEDKIPSDESFQNYSNGLDFPTNLFDTDRMPGLDISGNSRSDLFSPYVLEGENMLTNYMEYKNGSVDKIDDVAGCDNENNFSQQETEAPPAPCPYCNQNIAKGKRRRHVSQCPARRFECECKKVFTSKELLAQHIYTHHSNEKKAEEKEKEKNNVSSTNISDDPEAYTCEQCHLSFKRRGMLINHLWRKHGTMSARVPLKRRVRHYPCVACPKIYRTATKRNSHVQRHHPGSERLAARYVEGGTREATAAACPVCPRQYATRAKMLQHMRQHHKVAAVPMISNSS